MPYNFAAAVFTHRSSVADFLRKKSTFIRETDTLRFLPPLYGLRATYAVHPKLIGKPVVDLLLAIIELLSLGVRAEALRVNIDWKYPFFEAGEGVSLA